MEGVALKKLCFPAAKKPLKPSGFEPYIRAPKPAKILPENPPKIDPQNQIM